MGKNKRISKGKKGGKKKAQDPFARKDWYDVKAPSMFTRRSVGKTLVTRTTGTKVATLFHVFQVVMQIGAILCSRILLLAAWSADLYDVSCPHCPVLQVLGFAASPAADCFSVLVTGFDKHC